MRRLKAWLAVAGLAITATAGAVVHAPAASADRYNDTCTYATQNLRVVGDWMTRDPVGELKSVGGGAPVTRVVTVNYENTETATIDRSVGISFGKLIEVAAEVKVSAQSSRKVAISDSFSVTSKANEVVYAQATVDYREVYYFDTWRTPAGKICMHQSFVARFPVGDGICTWIVDLSECNPRQPRRAGNGPGTAPAPPSGPAPVTDVRGLPDSTLLHTTDTKRVYKMVGGAPVWQSTCDDGICQGQQRPTSQGVINAGPATPRNDATAVDQRGMVYKFVGGAPLWQDACRAPVNCGTPVKVSNWSIDARDHMNQGPADMQLVQARNGDTTLPVAVTIGSALVPFANPQEVIDTGFGSDWASKVTIISPSSYHSLGLDPQDGTLVQGTGGGSSTPVAMIMGQARIPFANPQEVIDVGYGSNWQSKVRAIPTRAFEGLSQLPKHGVLFQGAGVGGPTPVAAMVGDARINFANPQELIDSGYGTDWASKVRAIPARAFSALRDGALTDGTLIQGTGGTPVAKIVGGARVNFANPQEVIDAGYGTDWIRHVRVVPGRAFNQIGTRIGDGVLLKKPGHDGIGVVVGGAWVPFHSMAELTEAGYKDIPVQLIPGRALDALPTKIGDGVLVKKPGHDGVGVVVGGAWVPFWSMAELTEAGYQETPVHTVPGRVLDGLPTTIGDGVLVKKPGHDGIGVIVGGAWVPFHSMAELIEAGYKDAPVRMVPGRVLDGLPTTIGDGVRIGKAGQADQGAVVGGAKVPFQNIQELNQAGYGDKPLRMIPPRVWDALPTKIGDGVRIGKAGQADQGAVVGGAKIPFQNIQELNEAGYGDKPLRMIPSRVWDALPTTIGDGTKIKAPDSSAVWVVTGGRRAQASAGGQVWTVPTRVVNAIPIA